MKQSILQLYRSAIEVTMMNLVAFNVEEEYGDSKEKPCSGVQAYLQRYAPVINEVAGVKGIKVIYVGTVVYTIFGPDEPEWDVLALVRYPDFAALRKVIESPLYWKKLNRTGRRPQSMGIHCYV